MFLWLISSWCSQACQRTYNFPSGRAQSGVAARVAGWCKLEQFREFCHNTFLLESKVTLVLTAHASAGTESFSLRSEGTRRSSVPSVELGSGFWVCLCRSWRNSPAQGMVEMNIYRVAGKKVYCFVDNLYEIDVV